MHISKIPDTQYNCYNPVSDLHKRDNVKTPRKIGAIETGWNTDFQAAKFAEDEATLERQFSLDNNQYLLAYPKHELHKHDGERAVHKPGPIETGRINYKAAEFGMYGSKIPDNQYDLAYPKHELNKRDNVKTPRKIGAIETGWNTDFQGAKFAEDEATLEKQFSVDKNQYLLAYPKHELHKHDGEHAEHKPGPIETGKIAYEAADYGMHISKIPDTQYNCYNPVSDLHKRDNVKTPRKIGAIETGWNDYEAYNSNVVQKNKMRMPKKNESKRESKANSSSSSRGVTPGKAKTKDTDVTDEEIDAYLPERFSPSANSAGKRTRGMTPNNAERDSFSDDIMGYARKSLEKRRSLKISIPK